MNNKGLVLRGGSLFSSSADARFFQSLKTALVEKAPVGDQIGRSIFATESIDETAMTGLQQAASNLESTLAAVLGGLGRTAEKGSEVFVQESAAVIGGLCATAPSAFASRTMEFPKHSTDNFFAISAGNAPGYVGHRSTLFATEAFDNRETRNAMLYTMAYNYSVSRQDEFGETIWPTLTLPADQVGFGIIVNRLCIHRGVTHTIDGKVVQFNKIDLMRAERDSTVLHKNKTRIYPVARADAADKLVAASIIAPYDIDNEGVTIKTAPYRVGAEIGVMGISQTDAMLDGGSANQTDTLDPACSLEKVYVLIGEDVIGFNVYGLPTANFTYAPQGMDKQRNLQFRSKACFITPTTVQSDSGPLVTLATIVTNKLKVEVELQASGILNTEFDSVQVHGNVAAMVKVYDADGVVLPSTNANVQDIATAFASAKIVGYDLRAYRTNINMRERGDFIDRTSFTQLYEVPLLSPITAQRPQNTDGQQDAGDFEALVTTTRFRLKNDAVTAIFEATTRLEEHVHAGVISDDLPSLLGASRFHVKPVFYSAVGVNAIDVPTMVDSLSSGDRLKDLQSAVINKLRDIAFDMYVHSEYPAAASALGMTGPATIIIATDPKIHRYIMLDGDLRTLTEKFNIRVVSTIDARFENKIFMTFGVFDENRNSAPNLLNWGNLIWAPEVVMSASVPRGESMSRETIVQPRYLFVQHLPIAAMIEFKNLSNVFNKVPLEVNNTVTP